MDTFELRPPPPVRAYALAGVLTGAGAVLTAVAATSGWAAGLVAFGLALVVAGVVLGVAAVVAARGMRVRVELTDEGYHLSGPAGERDGTWAEVTRVTLAADGHRLTLHHSPDRRTLLVAPGGGRSPRLEELGEAMARRLDADRGYRDLI